MHNTLSFKNYYNPAKLIQSDSQKTLAVLDARKVKLNHFQFLFKK